MTGEGQAPVVRQQQTDGQSLPPLSLKALLPSVLQGIDPLRGEGLELVQRRLRERGHEREVCLNTGSGVQNLI